MSNLICPRCDGSGRMPSLFPTVYAPEADGMIACRDCDGQGDLPPLDEAAIRRLIKGRAPMSLRSNRPVYAAADADRVVALNHRRAYYVWRMARFGGGIDVTLPVMASMSLRSDPARAELDKLADTIAREAFGSDLRGAARWGRALGVLS